MDTHPLTTHVAAASLNQTVGDWTGNMSRIRRVIEKTKATGARLLVLPEMCIPGYSLGDRLMMRGTLQRSWRALMSLRSDCRGLVVLFGLPVRHRDVLYNAVAVVADGELCALVPKENLATGDVQYENRWFTGWPRGRVETFRTPDGKEIPFGSLVFAGHGLGRFGVEVCEDGWKGIRPGSVQALSGAHIIANPSASWFTLGKHRVRRRMVEQISREDHTVYLYTSLLGCDATRLIFDGSVFIAQDGKILDEGQRFVFDKDHVLVHRVVDLAGLQRARMEEGSWRQQVESLQRQSWGAEPQHVFLPGDYSTEDPAPDHGPYWLENTTTSSADPSLDWLTETGLIKKKIKDTDLPHLELELAIAMGLSEYRRKCGIKNFVLALSGGRDSAMVALLVARAFRYEQPNLSDEEIQAHIHKHFFTAYLSTDNSGDHTRLAAAGVAKELGADHMFVNVQAAVNTHVDLANTLMGINLRWEDKAADIPLQNVQARLRGSLIWMVANVKNGLLLATSNKSEAAVGYTTMDGDTSGGLAPISDVPKSLVNVYLRWAMNFHELDCLKAVIEHPATAELRPKSEAQTDEDDLMPFAVLDQLIYHFVQRGQEPLELFRTLWPVMADRYNQDANALREHIHKFITLFCRAQWKRERFAISFRVAAFDLDPKTGFRFPPVQAPFTVELAQLDAHVDALIARNSR